jgi:hypothetical protein
VRLRYLGIAGLVLLLVRPAVAWNYSGHWIIAAIAYDRLTPAARARVDDLIRRHPDYEMILTKDAPAEPGARAQYAFVRAAGWPDVIRSDPRFYDETRANSSPTPTVSGFPDMQRHPTWHYYNTPYTQDGSPVKMQSPPHLLSELPRLMREVASKTNLSQAAYDLPWVLHLIGDAHQPLHSSNRFLKSQPNGDAGGNYVFVRPGRTLHSVWDDAAAKRDMPYGRVLVTARELAKSLASPPDLSFSPEKWIEESFALVKSDVYTFGLKTGTKRRPIALPSGYITNAKRISRQRVAEAGYRLAAALNAALR